MGIGKWVAAGIGLVAVGGAIAYAQYRDTEKAPYDVLFADGDFEVRQYAPMIVAEVTHIGDRQRASGASFRRLAAYIFAEDRPAGGESIAMTSPVLQEETAKDEWRMRFVMPSQYTIENLPKPPQDITLTEVPRRRVVAVRFSGNAKMADLVVMEARLTDWIKAEGLTPIGSYEYAFYDAPMVPGPLRRNEVLIEVEPQ